MASRPKRANAGNKMAKLLNEEEEDEFYKTTYGGFDETEQDNDYKLVSYHIFFFFKTGVYCLLMFD